jgi:AmmeMemoRadiSam system protein B
MQQQVRAMAVAGRFYPAEAEELRQAVEGFIARAADGERGGVRAIVAPHAGYLYSGPIAGVAFRAIAALKGEVRRVVVIGPAHHVGFRGIAVASATHFATPLGNIPLDRAAIDSLADLRQVVINDAAHAPEHALEVELPFLIATLGLLPIVPLLIGRASDEDVVAVLQRLWDATTLVIVSTDLSHYHDDATARRLDGVTAAAVLRRDESRLGPDDACGFRALRALVVEARRRGLVIEQLALGNSGAASGPRAEVVGYGAFAVREAS